MSAEALPAAPALQGIVQLLLPGDVGGRTLLMLAGKPLSAAELARLLARHGRGDGAVVLCVVGNPWRQRLRRWVRGLRDASLQEPSLGTVRRALRGAGCTAMCVHAAGPEAESLNWSRPARWPRDVLAPAYIVVAGASLAPSRLDRILEVLVSGNDHGVDSVSRLIASEKDKSLVFARLGARDIVVRVTHSEASQQAESAAHAVLQAMAARPPIAAMVPAPIGAGVLGGWHWFAETRLAGRPLAQALSARRRDAYASQVGAFLEALHATAGAVPAPPGRAWVASLLEPMLERVLPAVTEPALRRHARQLLEVELRDACSRVGLVHGDFSANNILVQGARVVGVIDWENARHDAPPVLDAMNYLDSVQRHSVPSLTLADTVPMLAQGDWPVAAEWRLVEETCRRSGIDLARHRRGFALLYWLCHVGPQLKFAGAAPEAVNRKLTQVLRRFVD